MRKHGMPEVGELVVCRITKLHPHSAFAKLIEYDKPGMIHVSEVASRWVRNIREFLKENQYVVCRVMRIERDSISLSVKRVHRDQANRKLNEFKKERRAEKLLEMVAKGMNKTLEQAYEEAGHKLLDEFGSLSKVLEIAVKNPELFKGRVSSVWSKPIMEAAVKAYAEKEYEVRAELNLVCPGPEGIVAIKKTLTGAAKKGLDVKYISAPKYVLMGRGKDRRELESAVTSAAEGIVKEIQKSSGEASFKLEK